MPKLLTDARTIELRKKNSECRDLKKHLRDLTEVVTQCLAAYDAEMCKPSNSDRGSRIAKISNALNLQNDIAKRFGLGVR